MPAAFAVLKSKIRSFPDNLLLKKQQIIFLLLNNQPELTLKQLDIFMRLTDSEDAEMQSYRLLAKQLIAKEIMPLSDLNQLLNYDHSN